MELKEILGDDLFNQVQEQLKGKGPQGKDVELVATNTGDYVPATKYEALKSGYAKVTTDYATLNSKYEELNASKDKDIKSILIRNELSKANITKVNGSYDYLMPMLEVDKMKLDNGKLVDDDKIIEGFITANPSLVMGKGRDDDDNKDRQNDTNPSIPAGNGTNPPAPQGNEKDRAYYENAYKNTKDLAERCAIKREAGEKGIQI